MIFFRLVKLIFVDSNHRNVYSRLRVRMLPSSQDAIFASCSKECKTCLTGFQLEVEVHQDIGSTGMRRFLPFPERDVRGSVWTARGVRHAFEADRRDICSVDTSGPLTASVRSIHPVQETPDLLTQRTAFGQGSCPRGPGLCEAYCGEPISHPRFHEDTWTRVFLWNVC